MINFMFCSMFSFWIMVNCTFLKHYFITINEVFLKCVVNYCVVN